MTKEGTYAIVATSAMLEWCDDCGRVIDEKINPTEAGVELLKMIKKYGADEVIENIVYNHGAWTELNADQTLNDTCKSCDTIIEGFGIAFDDTKTVEVAKTDRYEFANQIDTARSFMCKWLYIIRPYDGCVEVYFVRDYDFEIMNTVDPFNSQVDYYEEMLWCEEEAAEKFPSSFSI